MMAAVTSGVSVSQPTRGGVLGFRARLSDCIMTLP